MIVSGVSVNFSFTSVTSPLSGEKTSVLSRAAFEITVNHLLHASRRGETDFLQGVAENIIVGQPVNLGTGAVKLVMKRSKPKKKVVK